MPTHIIANVKRIIPRQVIKKNQNDETIIEVEREEHLRIQVIWKDKSISWYAADVLRLQNPFLFIPYVIKNKLSKHNHFL